MKTRRGFLSQTAAGAVALSSGAVSSLLAENKTSPLDLDTPPIIDTHQHLWDLTKLHPPWLKPGGELTRSFVMKDYLEATQGVKLDRAVYMEVAVALDDKRAEAEYVIELCRKRDNPTVAAVIGGIPGTTGFRDYILGFRNSSYIKGVRHIPSGGGSGEFLYEQAEFVRDVRLLGDLGMRFDLCAPPQRLPDAIRVVDQCPDTQFICDHCGNADPKAFWDESRKNAVPDAGRPGHDADQWRRDMVKLAQRQNVVCKISGVVSRAPKSSWLPDDLAPIVNHCLESFGPDRVMFASDWPVCTRTAALREWVAALNTIVRDRSDQQRAKLFGKNAIRVYELPKG
jgi:L-fuconolactonase